MILGKNKEGQNRDLTDAATPVSNISAFCRAVLARILTLELFGSGDDGKQNWASLMQNVVNFVKCKRYERMSLHTVAQKIKVTKPV